MKNVTSKKRVIAFSLLILISVLNLRCSDNKTIKPPTSTPPDYLVPLSVGNYWEFQIVERFYTNDQWEEEIFDSIGFRIVDTFKIDVNGDSVMAAVQELYFPGSNRPLEARWLKQNLEDGFYRLGGVTDEDTLINKTPYLKYPVSQGEVWSVPWLGYDLWNKKFVYPDTLSFTCILTDTLLKTQFGYFKCVLYYYEKSQGEDIQDDDLIYDYYAPGIGLVGKQYKTEATKYFPEYIGKEWLLYNYKTY